MPQALFLRYALPVVGHCLGERVSLEEKKVLEDVLKGNTRIQTSVLRKYFPGAVGRIPVWTSNNVLDYWLRQHNGIKKDNRLCQTYATRVGETPSIYQNQNGIFKGKELIIPDYVNVDKGDIVSIHNFTIAHKLTPKMITEYFPNFK